MKKVYLILFGSQLYPGFSNDCSRYHALLLYLNSSNSLINIIAQTPAVVSNIKLRKEKALRKHSLHEKTAASVLLKHQ